MTITQAFLAVFMYGMFYFTFVPSPEHEGQIFLEFEPCHETPGTDSASITFKHSA
jgi:hypothetical protein